MADYPTVLQAFGSVVKGDDGTRVDLAVSGKSRFRSYYTKIRDRIDLMHDLDDTDKALIEAHYVTDKKLAFNFTFDADSTLYTVRYANVPQYKPKPGNRWDIKITFIVV